MTATEAPCGKQKALCLVQEVRGLETSILDTFCTVWKQKLIKTLLERRAPQVLYAFQTKCLLPRSSAAANICRFQTHHLLPGHSKSMTFRSGMSLHTIFLADIRRGDGREAHCIYHLAL